MAETVQVINQQEVLGKDFKMYGTFEEPLFLAKDVAGWVDYSKDSKGNYNVSAMLAKVDDDEKTKVFTNLNNVKVGSNTWFLTEDGLYEVLMQSRKPIAKQFKKQVKTILKEIRKTGSYTLPATYEDALEDLLKTTRENRLLQERSKQIREDSIKVLEYTESVKPAVALGSQYLDAMVDLTLSEFATLMQGTKVIPYGRNTFYQQLRNHGYITTATPLRATQRAISGELMYNVTGTLERNGNTINTVTVMVTSKGVESLIRTFMGKEGVKQLKALGQYEELVEKFKKYEEG